MQALPLERIEMMLLHSKVALGGEILRGGGSYLLPLLITISTNHNIQYIIGLLYLRCKITFKQEDLTSKYKMDHSEISQTAPGTSLMAN